MLLDKNQKKSEKLEGAVKNFKGLLGDSKVYFSQYKGVDFSKLAFLFCGQGQMIPGVMADNVESSEFFRARLDELDRIAKEEGVQSPSSFILSPSKTKDISMSSVLCLYTLQTAMFETLILNGYFPNILTAHSFGEFAQLTAAGVVNFENMVQIIISRQKSLQNIKGDFTMFAVSNSAQTKELSSKFNVYPANINTNLQTSFVCEERDFKNIQKDLKSRKVAVVKVNVDYPYHTPWLLDAKEVFEKKLKDLNFTVEEQKIPFISSVTGEYFDKGTIEKEKVISILTSQFIKPVNFVKQIKKVIDHNISHFIELSPIDVLTPFVEQTAEGVGVDYKTTSFNRKIKKNLPPKKVTGSLKNSKMMGVFNKALKSLSGYSIDDIQLEDRIREDLGIDSIKKAEIIFEIADNINLSDQNAAPLNLAELATFGDILNYFERSIEAKSYTSHKVKEKNIEFSLLQKDFYPEQLVDYSSHDGKQRIKIFDLNSLFAEIENINSCKKTDVFVLTSFGNTNSEKSILDKSVEWMCFFQKTDLKAKKWIFLHDGNCFSEMISSFLVAWAQEKSSSFKSIKLCKKEQVDKEIIYKESFDFFSNEIEYTTKNERRVKKYSQIKTKKSKKLSYKKVVIFGGMGGIGRQLLDSLKYVNCEEVIIVGRTAEKHLNIQVDQLKVASKVSYIAVDVTDLIQLEAVVNSIEQSGKIDLAIHSVGYEFSRLLSETTEKEIYETINAKITLACFLEKWAQQNPESLVVFNSSVIAEFGNIGQAPYALANRYLDSLSDKGNNIVSILWPAWEGVGMASDEFIAKSLKLQGLPSLSSEKGKSLFIDCLRLSSGKVYILSADFMSDYLAINQSRSELKELFQSASKSRHIYVLSGLTQEKQPYLKDHLVKRVCLFPASGSLALMLFKGYQEKGIIGQIRSFSAHNFLIVGEKSSNYVLESAFNSESEMFLQVKANQLISETTINFERWSSQKRISHFESTHELESEFDQNIAVYIGPKFKLDQGVFLNKKNHLLLEIDLSKSPQYTGVDILDKLHKLIEASFHSACLKSLWDHSKMVVPKSISRINFDLKKFKGHCYYPVVETVKSTEAGCHCSVFTYNKYGELVFEIKDIRLILVKQYQEETKILRKTKSSRSFFNVL